MCHLKNNTASFEVGDAIKIDGKGHAAVTKLVQRGFCVNKRY